jgi:hypothetical protein
MLAKFGTIHVEAKRGTRVAGYHGSELEEPLCLGDLGGIMDWYDIVRDN